MPQQTIRDIVKNIQKECRSVDLTPDHAADLLVMLTAIISNIADEQREADWAYAVELLRLLESEEAASRAKIRAETTPQYQRKREARDLKELAIELIRSLKMYLRTKADERQWAGHQ